MSQPAPASVPHCAGLLLTELDLATFQHAMKSDFLSTIIDKPRIKQVRHKGHLIRIAKCLPICQPARIFVNPTDIELDRVFAGGFYGY